MSDLVVSQTLTASVLPNASELQYSSTLHRYSDKAVLVAGEALQSSVREIVNLGSQVL